MTPADLSNYEDAYIEKGRRNISEIGLEYSSAILLPKNSIIFSSRAPIGYVAITKNELATNQGFKNLILSESINSKYTYYYLKTVKELAENMASGTTFLELSTSKFKQIPFPLAPIEEQNRIVEKIDELLSELNKSTEELIKSKELTQKLIKKTTYNLFKNLNNSKPLKDVSEIIMGQSPDSKSYNSKGIGVPLFQGKKEFTDLFPIVEKWTTNPIRLAKENDILMSVRAPVGDVNIANLECSIGRGLSAIRFNGYYKFLFYFLDSIKQEIRDLGTGSTFSSISRDIISNILIPFPEYTTQVELINELEIKIISYSNIINEISVQIFKNENLKNKIIKEAFQGKLSERFNSDLNIDKLITQIQTEKSKHLSSQVEINKNRQKTERREINLLEHITNKYKNIFFTYTEIYNDLKISKNVLISEFKKLEENKKVKISIDTNTGTVKYILI